MTDEHSTAISIVHSTSKHSNWLKSMITRFY